MIKHKNIRMIFTGGGSGGHTMPAFSVIDSLSEYCRSVKIPLSLLYLGSENGLEKTMAKRYKVPFKPVSTGKLRRYLSLKNITDIFKVFKGISQSKKLINDFAPDLVFSTGGFVSVPPVIAAKRSGIPVIIHEQTVDAGLANKIAAMFASKIAVTFKESLRLFPKKKCVLTGQPLRKEIFVGNRAKAVKKAGFDPRLPILFFTGGGQGSHIINMTGLKILPELLKYFNIIFQTGGSFNKQDHAALVKFRSKLDRNKKKRLAVFDFINEGIGDIYAMTDLAVARSGAGTVNELWALAIPAVFVPLAIATKNEQYKNAKSMADAGGAVIIEEKDLTPELLSDTVKALSEKRKYSLMKRSLKNSRKSDGNKALIDLIMKEIRKPDTSL